MKNHNNNEQESDSKEYKIRIVTLKNDIVDTVLKRAQLLSLSPYFSKLIQHTESNILVLHNIAPVYFLYIINCHTFGAPLSIPSITDAIEILCLSDYLLIQTVHNDISSLLCNHVSRSSVYSYARLARTYNSPRLSHIVTSTFTANLYETYQNPEFQTLTFHDMLDIACYPLPESSLFSVLLIKAITIWAQFFPLEKRDEHLYIFFLLSGRFPNTITTCDQNSFLLRTWQTSFPKMYYSNYVWALLNPDSSFTKHTMGAYLSPTMV